MNGGNPIKNSYIRIPNDHISGLLLYPYLLF